MRDKYIMQTSSPVGYEVVCSQKRFDEHIKEGHEIMANNLEAIKDTIHAPEIVYKSNQQDNRDVYFKRSSLSSYSMYTEVVVELPQKNVAVGEVVTAFPTKKISSVIEQGQVLYASNDEDKL